MARSMVSTGTEASRALLTIVWRVALASVSAAPSRAATSIWRMSLANSFPGAWSAAPFLCLIECHFEWPLMALPSSGLDGLQEPFVDAQIPGQLGMERGAPHRSLVTQDGAAVVAGGGLGIGPRGPRLGGAGGHPRERP